MMKKVVVMMITPVLAASLFTAYKMSGGKNIPDSPGKIATISTLREREEKGEYAATEWPNNLQTQQIPEPPFEIVGENTIIEDVGERTYEKACFCFDRRIALLAGLPIPGACRRRRDDHF